jgi:hypothetical protein
MTRLRVHSRRRGAPFRTDDDEEPGSVQLSGKVPHGNTAAFQLSLKTARPSLIRLPPFVAKKGEKFVFTFRGRLFLRVHIETDDGKTAAS